MWYMACLTIKYLLHSNYCTWKSIHGVLLVIFHPCELLSWVELHAHVDFIRSRRSGVEDIFTLFFFSLNTPFSLLQLKTDLAEGCFPCYVLWEPNSRKYNFWVPWWRHEEGLCCSQWWWCSKVSANTGKKELAPSPAVMYEEADYQRHKKLPDVKLPVKICGMPLRRSFLKTIDVKGYICPSSLHLSF